GRTRRRHRHRPLVLERAVSLRLLPDRRIDLAARPLGPAAAGEGVDQRRRARAALLLRIRLGGLLGAARALAAVEGGAALALGRRPQAGGLRGDSHVRRQPGAPRTLAANATNRPRR